jgi:formylglycine-generating enzyme required for sulfatase activity
MDKVLRRYVDEAIPFSSIRIAATLVTCKVAAAILNELRITEASPSSYRYVNVHNPAQPLRYDAQTQHWSYVSGFDEHPAWGINWAGAQLVCRHLGGRLPGVHEWERFASNDDPSRLYPWGNDEPSYRLANYDEHFGGTSTVGSFPPSEIGLYDVAGNLSEWCDDGQASLERVVKGGAWSKDAHYLQINISRRKWARLGTTTIGFRPVWDDR